MSADNRFSALVPERSTPAAPAAPVASKDWKYTIKLTGATRALIDEDVTRLCNELGRIVDRKDVTVALYELLHEDESLYSEVKRRILQNKSQTAV